MGINIRFTVAVIVIIAVGFGGSFYLFSSGFMDGIKIASFDKSKYFTRAMRDLNSVVTYLLGFNISFLALLLNSFIFC